jgi:hypothetical protein
MRKETLNKKVISNARSLFTEYYYFIRDLRLEFVNSGIEDFNPWIKDMLKSKARADTITMDLFPELYFSIGGQKNSLITNGKDTYDSFSVHTEELGTISSEMFPNGTPRYFDDVEVNLEKRCLENAFAVMDPLDGSIRLNEISTGSVTINRAVYNLGYYGYRGDKLGNALASFERLLHSLEKNPLVESPQTGISIVSAGEFIYSGVLNWVNGEIFEISEEGVLRYNALDPGKKKNVNFSQKKGKKIICFMGNEKKPGYLKNYEDVGFGMFDFVDTGYFTGPGRILYLTDLTEGVEVIASNNEKITEWSPMVHAALYSPELSIFSIAREDTVLLPYGLDTSKLKRLEDCRNCRENILITHKDNEPALEVLENMKKRGIYVKDIKQSGGNPNGLYSLCS